MSQDIYKEQGNIGYAGLEIGIGARKAESYINTTEEIPFGRAVVKIIGVEKGIKLPISSGDNFLGIAIAARGENQEFKFVVEKDVPVLEIGSIIVEVEQDVTPDDPVYVRYVGKPQVQSITFDSDLTSGATIDLKIDGVDMTQVPYNTSHAQTMADFAAQVLADFPQIATAVVSTAPDRTLTLTHAENGVEFVISDVVIVGGAEATVLEVEPAISDNDRGKLRKDSDGSTAFLVSTVKFKNNTADGLVRVDINQI